MKVDPVNHKWMANISMDFFSVKFDILIFQNYENIIFQNLISYRVVYDV